IKADDFEARADLLQVFQEKALGAADVEHPIAGLELPVIAERLGYRNPATVIAVAAVALRAIAVEVLAPELHGHVALLDLLFVPGGQVAARARVAVEQIGLSHGWWTSVGRRPGLPPIRLRAASGASRAMSRQAARCRSVDA